MEEHRGSDGKVARVGYTFRLKSDVERGNLKTIIDSYVQVGRPVLKQASSCPNRDGVHLCRSTPPPFFHQTGQNGGLAAQSGGKQGEEEEEYGRCRVRRFVGLSTILMVKCFFFLPSPPPFFFLFCCSRCSNVAVQLAGQCSA